MQASIAILERSGVHHDKEAQNIKNANKPQHQMSIDELNEIINSYPLKLAELTGQLENT